jgi:hypothetical protein
MSHIVLSKEQVQALTEAGRGLIEIRDTEGRSVGFFEFASEQEIVAECNRRRQVKGPTYSFQQIRSRLQVLEEAAKEGKSKEELWELWLKIRNESHS